MDILAVIRKRLTPTQIRYLYLFLAIGLYLVFAILNARYQAGDAPRSQVSPPFVVGSDVELHIQSPQKLTFDGQRRQGRITLTIKPNASTNSIPILSPLATAHPSPTLEPVSLLFTQPMTRTGCSRFMIICLSEMGALPASPSIPPVAKAVPVGDDGDQSDGGAVVEQAWSFLVSSSEGALLITSDGVSFTPIVTLSVSSNITEASFLIEHAALPNTPAHVQIDLEDRSNRQSYQNVVNISLESRWQLYLRRFGETFLSLASVFALIVVGIDYLRQEQKEGEDRERTQRELQQISDRIPFAQPTDIPALFQSWAQKASNLREPPVELRAQIKTVREAAQRVVRNDVAALAGPEAGWAKEVHAIARRFKESLDSEDIQILDDLRFVVNALRASAATPPEDADRSFSDAYLLGVYLNFAWAKMEINTRQEALNRLGKLAAQHTEPLKSLVMEQILWGIYACDERITATVSSSLRKELGKEYINIPEIDRQLFTTIARIAGSSEDSKDNVDRGLWEWCRNLQVERSRRASRRETKQRIREPLWPISEQSAGVGVKDANYDYQPPDKPDEATPDKPHPWDDASAELNQPYHHYVQGHQASGKSWLRIYFENAVWSDYSGFLPVYYFPPQDLLYEVENRAYLYRSFARSIANCLVAALLESYVVEEQEIQQIAPFLARYGYTVPLGEASLASPTPPKADLDWFYANRAQSHRLAQIREAMQRAQKRHSQTDEVPADQILRDVSAAVDTAGFSRVYLLIDNLPPRQEERIWSVLCSAEIGVDLQRYDIYLKMFGVSSKLTGEWSDPVMVENPITQAELRIYQQQLSLPF